MNIFIPSHLRNLKIVDQMLKMLVEYNNTNANINDDLSNEIKTKNLIDPVKSFLYLCIDRDEVEKTGQNYESIIDYLSSLFYSVKGTVKVFEYMKYYLGLKFEGDIIYTTDYIEFKLSEVKISDEHLFYNKLKGFLNSLLYFNRSNILTNSVKLILSNSVNSSLGFEAINYNNIFAIPYEIKDK